MIRKLNESNLICLQKKLLSKHIKENFEIFKTREAAAKQEQKIQYFKRH